MKKELEAQCLKTIPEELEDEVFVLNENGVLVKMEVSDDVSYH